MKSQITRNLPDDQYQAAINANAPTGANPFATIADIGGVTPTLAQVLTAGASTGGIIITSPDGFQQLGVVNSGIFLATNIGGGADVTSFESNGSIIQTTFAVGGITAGAAFSTGSYYMFHDVQVDIDSPIVNFVTGGPTLASGADITFNNSGFTATISEPTLAGNIVLTLPSATGTLALVSQIPSTPSWSSVLAVGNTSGANNVIINTGQSLTVPLIYGGTAVGSFIDHISTTAAGTTTGLAWRLNGGNNGATNIVNYYNDAQVVFNGSTRNPTGLGIVRVMQGTSTIDIGESSSAGTIWMNQTTPSATNYVFRGSSTTTTINASTAIALSIGNVTKVAVTTGTVAFTPAAISGGVANAFSFVAAASTLQTAGTESTTVNWNLGASMQHASNTIIATQRDVVINARTHTFQTAGGVITDAVTWSAAGGPIAGTNATITNNHAIRIASNNVAGAGTTTNSYGLTVNAQTGATNNYVAQFLGGNTGFITSAPTAYIHIGAGTATAGTAPLKLTSSGTGLTGLLTVAEAGAVEFTTYGMWITNTAAVRQMNWMGLVAQAAPATNAIGVILDYYGTSPTRVLTTPDTFFSITGNDGQIYKVPGYI